MKKRAVFVVLCISVFLAAAAFGDGGIDEKVFERNLLIHAIMDFAQREAVGKGAIDAEPFVAIKRYDSDIIVSGSAVNTPFIRESLARKLAAVNKRLKPLGLTLKITYGYRTLEAQKTGHENRCLRLIGEWTVDGKTYTGSEFVGRTIPSGAPGSGDIVISKGENISQKADPTKFHDMDLHEAADPFTAYPPIAGHPTGGCSDTRIARLDTGEEIPFAPSTEGMLSSEVEIINSTFGQHPGITAEMFNNRMLLHDLMLDEGFAPFYGEWWHFMYGDSEWAAFTGAPSAIYAAPEVSLVSTDVNIDLSEDHPLDIPDKDPVDIPSYTTEEKNLLSHAIMTFEQREAVAVGTSVERMVDARKYDSRIITEQREDMIPYVGDIMPVRDTVARMLSNVNKKLTPQGYTLKLVYGYRHPEIQELYFNGVKEWLRGEWEAAGREFTVNELDRAADLFAAYPPIAGHPTGGCVDIRIARLSDGTELDFSPSTEGMTSEEEEEIMGTFSKNITEPQLANRMLLHDAMLDEGFAPYYGEWWHFMYGDREWAAFTGRSAALYGPLELTSDDIETNGHSGGCSAGAMGGGVFALILTGAGWLLRRKIF
jgi:D-alanyl-D-alanine dipeptidase